MVPPFRLLDIRPGNLTASDICWLSLKTCKTRVHLMTLLSRVLTSSGRSTYGWQADSTHPIGMYSCWCCIFTFAHLLLFQTHFMQSALPSVLPWCMVYHFNTRTFATACLVTLWRQCEHSNLSDVIKQHPIVNSVVEFHVHNSSKYVNLYRPQTNSREGNVFTVFCLSMGGGVISLVPCPFRGQCNGPMSFPGQCISGTKSLLSVSTHPQGWVCHWSEGGYSPFLGWVCPGVGAHPRGG